MKKVILTGIAAAAVAATASADITGAVTYNYVTTAEDFGGTSVTVNVSDLYLLSDDAADTVLNVYNMQMASAGQVNYFQSATGTGWTPTNLGGIFDTAALRLADSFVTVGGFTQDTLLPEQAPGIGAGMALDPDFGPSNVDYPSASGGWYNSSPPSLAGQVGQVARPDGSFGLGVLIGRFAYDGDFSLEGTTLEVTWNQGLNTPAEQLQVPLTVIPAPGALALLSLASLLGGRRRRG